MVRDTAEQVAQTRFGIDFVELCSADEAVDCGGTFSAGIHAAEQVVPLSGSDTRNARSTGRLSISNWPSSQ